MKWVGGRVRGVLTVLEYRRLQSWYRGVAATRRPSWGSNRDSCLPHGVPARRLSAATTVQDKCRRLFECQCWPVLIWRGVREDLTCAVAPRRNKQAATANVPSCVTVTLTDTIILLFAPYCDTSTMMDLVIVHGTPRRRFWRRRRFRCISVVVVCVGSICRWRNRANSTLDYTSGRTTGWFCPWAFQVSTRRR